MKRELSITLPATGREVAVSVDGPAPDGRFVVGIDGVFRTVDAERIRAGTWSLMIDGRAVVVDLDTRRGQVHASTGAAEVALVVEDARHKRLRQAAKRDGGAAAGEKIHAPIAGKVVKVLVAAGDTVTAGQPVIVLEAMKMENELASERGGVVHAVHKTAGQSVDTGELLVELH
jgi:glutaconyl-CoA/methylmalonyl-CoA decarboxylase subunit gamma